MAGETDKDRRPVPDPTTLTEAALKREVGGLKELFDTRLTGELKALDERFFRVEQALEAIGRRIDDGDQRLREHVEAQVGQIKAALDSARRETAFAQEASEKAINKAEAAGDKRFDGLRELVESQVAELRERLSEVATQVGKIV